MKHKEVGQSAEEHRQYAAIPINRHRETEPPARYIFGIDDPQPDIGPTRSDNEDKNK